MHLEIAAPDLLEIPHDEYFQYQVRLRSDLTTFITIVLRKEIVSTSTNTRMMKSLFVSVAFVSVDVETSARSFCFEA